MKFYKLKNLCIKRFVFISILFCSLGLISLHLPLEASHLEEADEYYAKRDAGFNPGSLMVEPVNIEKAIEAYLKAVEESSGAKKEEALWKLLRAYYFKGNFTIFDRASRRELYEEARVIAYKGLEEFPDSRGINLWTAVIWGVWAQEYGTWKAARKGVAGKMKALTNKVIDLDENYDDAAGYRLLGRLHFKSPRIPLFLGWPSNKKAQLFLEKAYKLAPHNLWTQQYLAEVLYKREQEDRAKALMRKIISTEETVHGVVEDAWIKREAADMLKKWEDD
jgi:tetratricopeptide (TPR) repeat protein